MQKVILLAIVLTCLIPANAHAKAYTMVFLYPGEAGSTAEAEPVLDEFFDYIGGKLKAEFGGKYFNSLSEGLAYIKKQKPQFGIVSWIALNENEAALPPFGIIAQTQPLPGGEVKDQFTIVGTSSTKGEKWTAPEKLVIYSSIPMGLAFFKTHLAPDLSGNITLKTTDTILTILKDISSGALQNTVALLTPTEMHTLENLKSEWVKGIATLYKCRAIPTAPLIAFGDGPPLADELMRVLMAMPHDKEGKEILETLRLKGFQ